MNSAIRGTHRAAGFSPRGLTKSENVAPHERPRKLKLAARKTPLIRVWWALPSLLLTALLATAAFAQGADDTPPAVRFEYIDIYVDSGDAPLAAYQFEITDAAERIKIVGIEGGEHEAFATPPYYDPKALKNNRVIIAALSTADELPTGQTRVATVHVQIEVDVIPKITINLTIAGDVQGNEINAEVSFVYSD